MVKLNMQKLVSREGRSMCLFDPTPIVVDGVTWHQLDCYYWFADWLEQQDPTMWKGEGPQHMALYVVKADFMPFVYLKWL